MSQDIQSRKTGASGYALLEDGLGRTLVAIQTIDEGERARFAYRTPNGAPAGTSVPEPTAFFTSSRVLGILKDAQYAGPILSIDVDDLPPAMVDRLERHSFDRAGFIEHMLVAIRENDMRLDSIVDATNRANALIAKLS